MFARAGAANEALLNRQDDDFALLHRWPC